MRSYLAYGSMALVAALVLAGCVMGPPPIARDESLKDGIHSEGWTEVLNQRFPEGAAEKELQHRLIEEGFLVMPSRQAARYSWGAIPCEHVLEVRWEADKTGKLVQVIGEYDEVCLGDENQS